MRGRDVSPWGGETSFALSFDPENFFTGFAAEVKRNESTLSTSNLQDSDYSSFSAAPWRPGFLSNNVFIADLYHNITLP